MTSLVSFALLVLGVALWFAATGSPFLTPDAALSSGGALDGVGVGSTAARTVVALPSVSGGVVALADGARPRGLGFKLSLVPFHAWTPDGIRRRVGARRDVPRDGLQGRGARRPARRAARRRRPRHARRSLSIAVLAALSMTLGNVMALRQDDVVRLLAWSTVAQAGWVVLPLVSISALGVGASATYLLTYVVATLVAFAVVAVDAARPARQGALDRGDYEGLWQRSPWRAGALALALTSLAGLPPGIIGLVGKIIGPATGRRRGLGLARRRRGGQRRHRRRRLPPLAAGRHHRARPTAGARRAGSSRCAGRRPRRRPVMVAGLVLASAVLVVVSVQPDLLLRLLG